METQDRFDNNGSSGNYGRGPEPGSLAAKLLLETNADAIITEAPKQPFRLGFFSTSCLIINRVVGTGIFNSPGTVIRGTNSAGGAMLLWFVGCVYGLAGMYVYVEYGLNVPRYVIDGIEQVVPRSGGDLHYLQYVYRWLHYKKDTILLSGCLFGISFICLGNMAGNSIKFAVHVLKAANSNPDNNGVEPSKEIVRGVALAAAAFACIIHSVSRRGGIWLSNFFACVKVGILLAILALAIMIGVRNKEQQGLGPSVVEENFKEAFSPPKLPPGLAGCESPLGGRSENGYGRAFLSIIFAFSGFDQANYVLGEVSRPRRTFPRAAFFSMSLISVLYMAVNVCYMAAIPAFSQQLGVLDSCPNASHPAEVVALLFFKRAFPSAADDKTADRVFNALLAFSSFGNIIVMTYTAARMKQEIAKQGFIPFPQFFGRNVDLSVGRLAVYLRGKGIPLLNFLRPENHREPTPVGALVLHLVSCAILIFLTFGMRTNQEAYELLTNLAAYLITAFFGSLLALGILLLRIFGPPQTDTTTPPDDDDDSASLGTPARKKSWTEMTSSSPLGIVNPYLSTLSASLYLLLNLFPVIASWVPSVNSAPRAHGTPWWHVPAISWVVLAFSAAWWLGFLVLAKYRSRRHQKEFVYEVRPEFDWAEPEEEDGHDDVDREGRRRRDEGKILAHETILLAWVGGEMGMFERGTGRSHDGRGMGMGMGSGARNMKRRPGGRADQYPDMGEREAQQGDSGNAFAETDFDMGGFGGGWRVQ